MHHLCLAVHDAEVSTVCSGLLCQDSGFGHLSFQRCTETAFGKAVHPQHNLRTTNFSRSLFVTFKFSTLTPNVIYSL